MVAWLIGAIISFLIGLKIQEGAQYGLVPLLGVIVWTGIFLVVKYLIHHLVWS